MKRLVKYVLIVSLISIAGAAFAADEAQAAAPAPEGKKVKREPMSMDQRIAKMEERLAAEKAKATPDQEKITKMEASLEAAKSVQKLEADRKAMLAKDPKADTTAIDQQLKEAQGKLQAMRPNKGGVRKGGGHKAQ
ncbi:MAG: hypothetical protein ACYC4Q_08735 [Victivallaceae bacterium]